MGGTFDPPHSGHLFISNFSLIKLDLDEVWWIVTNNNPLKKGSNCYEKRLNLTKKFLCHRKIKLLEIKKSENAYTIDTIVYLKKKYKKNKFIWLMGTDNLKNLHHWKDWKKIFYNIPIAIFDRPFYSLSIPKAQATLHFKEYKISSKLSKKLKFMKTPSWSFITGLTHLQSSTKIRENKVGSP